MKVWIWTDGGLWHGNATVGHDLLLTCHNYPSLADLFALAIFPVMVERQPDQVAIGWPPGTFAR